MDGLYLVAKVAGCMCCPRHPYHHRHPRHQPHQSRPYRQPLPRRRQLNRHRCAIGHWPPVEALVSFVLGLVVAVVGWRRPSVWP
jgi:DNA-binding transcriptional LysR family regulator